MVSVPGFLGHIDLTTLLVFVLVFLLGFCVIKTPRSSIPGPFALPFIGNALLFLRMGKKRHVGFMDLREKYGDVFRVYVGKHLMVIISGYDNIYEAFVKHAAQMSNRPEWILPSDKTKEGIIERGVLFSSGDIWRRNRRFVLQTMRDFGMGKTSIDDVILDESKLLCADIASTKGRPITNLKSILTASVSNIIHSMVFGYRCAHDDEGFLSVLQAMDTLVKGPGPVLQVLPKFVQNFIATGVNERNKAREFIFEYLRKQIQEHEKTIDENNIRDLLDQKILSFSCNETIQEKIRHTVRIVVDLFIAGTETTATTLDWALLYLIEYSDVQEKCFHEIEKEVGLNREVHMSDKPRLPYVEATILEVQRLSNILDMTLPHASTEEVIIAGHVIPKDTIVMGHLKSAHMDPAHFPQPKEFRPQRFIDDVTGKITNKDRLIPFSIGPRVCAGEALAKSELFLMFTNLIQKFKFSKTSEDVLSFDGFTGATTSTEPFTLKAEPRF
ncbi:cytochrome P450 2C15-like isoform X2 [Ostrea edulis]|uniref:cytochrome P450 2C15-like isoform X2 n=1 Tax=Ostrea edulis TaxID=37623 RepID=UPI0024AF5980|nr:cytochrome P450 2C15-like isoform X2 [Ostrea edulis]